MVLLELVELIQGVLELQSLHRLNLFERFFQLIDALLGAAPLLPQLELIVPFVLLASLQVALLFELFDADFFLEILQLLVQAVDHLLATLEHRLSRVLLRLRPVQLGLFLLDPQLHFLEIILLTFEFEFCALVFTLRLSFLRPFIFQIARELHKLLIFLQFELIPLSPQFRRLLQ